MFPRRRLANLIGYDLVGAWVRLSYSYSKMHIQPKDILVHGGKVSSSLFGTGDCDIVRWTVFCSRQRQFFTRPPSRHSGVSGSTDFFADTEQHRVHHVCGIRHMVIDICSSLTTKHESCASSLCSRLSWSSGCPHSANSSLSLATRNHLAKVLGLYSSLGSGLRGPVSSDQQSRHTEADHCLEAHSPVTVLRISWSQRSSSQPSEDGFSGFLVQFGGRSPETF